MYVAFKQPGPAQVVKPFWTLGKGFTHARGVLCPSPLAMAELKTEVCHPPPSCTPRDKQVHGVKALARASFSKLYFLGNSKTKLLLIQVRLEVSKWKWHLCWNTCQAPVQTGPRQLETWCFLCWSRAQGIFCFTQRITLPIFYLPPAIIFMGFWWMNHCLLHQVFASTGR